MRLSACASRFFVHSFLFASASSTSPQTKRGRRLKQDTGKWRKHGVALEVIAAQLGHRTVLQVAQIYGRFQPTMDERQAEVRS